MRKHKLLSQLLSLVLVAALLIPSFPVFGSARNGWETLPWHSSGITPDPRDPAATGRNENTIEYADDDIVRVSIVLDGDSTLDKGYSTIDIANNKKAIAYRNELQAKQEAIETKIEKEVLAGKSLEVEWNLTLVANMISANVEYGKIEKIKSVKGVKDVVLEVQYAPAVTKDNLPVDPQMSTSSEQIGSGSAWADGYTGAGSTVAIIDTGIDLDHKSFDEGAFLFAIEKVLESGKEADLMEVSDIQKVLDQLNIVKLGKYSGDGSNLYQTGKIPFAFNYVDGDLDVTHDNDSQGEHGSHVTGIAAANRFIADSESESGYVDALTSVLTQGVAPDAQIITMKVFGKGGGAYDSDYMAAIEDALVLGADSVNLSLGSAMAGLSRSDAYESVLNKLVASDTVVTMSAGNSGYWSENSLMPYLYGDDVNFQTGGSPGSFTNSLGVASVDNVGFTGSYVTVGSDLLFYTETFGPRNNSLASIAGDYEYVIIDGIGSDEEFEAVESILEGKIALCYRGSISFYEKAVAAVDHGAIATIIINNVAGTINMDLTDYPYTEPAVSITYYDGELFWENCTDEGELNGVYYATGEITVGAGVASSGGQKSEDGSYTLSDFSSWGVPGSLIMKPEITAPGGNIYSVNGAIAGGQAYENMSGTSMAAPQVTGMAAVVAQYIRENAERFADTGLTQRGLINSLLMATAEPIIEAATGNYYSILAQGAGLANVGNAVKAKAYIVMDKGATASAADGKVKVELGDDPARNGVYKYIFTIYNTSGTENVYTLETTLFTQDLFVDYNVAYPGYNTYLQLDTWTTPISSAATYTVNGVPFDVDARIDADVNMDGYTNADDAQALLDYIAGAISAEGLDLTAGDVDGDGKTTTYDAHLILAGIEARLAVPANGSAEIEVTVEITDDLSAYKNGAYIEGFTFVKPIASEEGELDVTYSIPVLGFYGNWSDASMFDRVDLEGYFYGSEFYDPAYDADFSYTGEITNELDYKDGDDRNTYYLFGNPYTMDGVYHPEREALRDKDTLAAYYYSLIRNAGARMIVIYDSEGNPVYSTPISSEYAAFYYTNGDSWQYTSSGINLGVKVGDLNTAENESFTFEMYAIPEYYLTEEMYEDGVITLDELLPVIGKLGNGAVVSRTITVDNTAPRFVGEPLKGTTSGDLKIRVADNQYIAYAVALTRSGAIMYADITADDLGQTAAGQEVELVFSGADLALAGEYVAIAVYDYAGNMNVIEVKYGDHEYTAGNMYGFTSELFANSNNEPINTWLELDPGTVDLWDYDMGYELVDATDINVVAAEYIDGYIFQVDDNGILYIAPDSDPGYVSRISALAISPVDLAYDYSRNELYALTAGNAVYSIEPLTGRMTLAFVVSGPSRTESLRGIAIDTDGTFYFSGNYLYVVEDWNGSVTAAATRKTGSNFAYLDDVGVLAWDHNTDTLYLIGGEDYLGLGIIYLYYLYSVDLDTGAADYANDYGACVFGNITALFVVPVDIGDSDIDDSITDVVTGITVSPAEMKVMTGGSYQLFADVTPWNLSDKSVTWESSDESVAVVDAYGYVTAVGVGTATITATSVLDSTVSATSGVEVLPLPSYALKGLVYDNDSIAYWSSFDTQNPAGFKHLAQGSYYYAGTLSDNGTIYTHDGESVYAVDANTYAATHLFDINPAYLFPDAALNMYFAAYGAGETALMAPKANSAVLMIFLPESAGLYTVDLSSVLPANIVGITWVGVDNTNGYDYYYMILENGDLYVMYLSYAGSLGYGFVGSTGLDLTGAANPDGGSSASLIYDWDNYDDATGSEYLYLAHYADNADSAYLSVIQIGDDVTTMATISFGDDVWPVVSLYNSFEEEMFVTSTDTSDRFADIAFTEVNSISDLQSAAAVDQTGAAETAEAVKTVKKTITGSLNAITVDETEDKDGVKRSVIVDTEAHTVTMTVSVSDSTNGLAEVAYDADILSVVSVTGYTEHFTCFNADGVLTFDYAAADGLNGQIAKIVFSYEDQHNGIDTSISVTTLEDGAPSDEEPAVEEIPFESNVTTAHVWSAPVFTWSEDGKTATATFTCELDPTHIATVEAAVTSEVKTPATEDEAGTTTYTAAAEFNGETYTDTKDVQDIDKLDHVWSAPVFTWSEDGKTATATFTCELNHEHTMTVEATVTSEVKTPATEDKDGTTTYTATVEFNGETYTDTKDVQDIPATGPATKPDGPTTGDNSPIAFLTAMLLLSLIGMSAAYVLSRKYSRESK